MRKVPNSANQWDDQFKSDHAYPAHYGRKNIKTHGEHTEVSCFGKGLISGALETGKPSLTFYPYLEPVAGFYERSNPTALDGIRYNILLGLYDAGLFRPYTSTNRLDGLIDWISFPELFLGSSTPKYGSPEQTDTLINIWEDLCFHGDHTLYRHSLLTFWRFKDQYQDLTFVLNLVRSLAHIAIHNGDYDQSVHLCNWGLTELDKVIKKADLPPETLAVRQNQQITFKRRLLSAQFFNLRLDEMPSHIEKMKDVSTEVKSLGSKLSASDYNDQMRRCNRATLRLWSYYALQSIALGQKPDIIDDISQISKNFRTALKKSPRNDAEEMGLDYDTAARIASLHYAESMRREGKHTTAAQIIHFAQGWALLANACFAIARAVSIKRLTDAKQDHVIGKYIQNVSLEIARIGDQYSLWTEITDALIQRTVSRHHALLPIPNLEFANSALIKANHRLDVLRSSIDATKLRHGTPQIMACKLLIRYELGIISRL